MEKRYVVISIVIPLMSSRRNPTPGGDVDHPKTKRINPQRKVGRKMRNLKKLSNRNILYLSQVHRPSRYGKEKVTSPSETPSQDEQPSGSPSLRPDDAPKE